MIQVSHGILRTVLAITAGIFLCGCETVKEASLTSNLWHSDSYSKTASPANPSELAVFEEPASGRLLIRYNEYSERCQTTQLRAYWHADNWRALDNHKAPHFVAPSDAAHLRLVAAGTNEAEGLALSASGHAVFVPGEDGHSYVVYRHGRREATYQLPIYDERKGNATKTALTPLTATADAATAGIVAGVTGAYMWLVRHR